MTWQPKSIEDHITCLARLTGAPEPFVDQVRSLFTSKGISLETDAEPFVDALEEAFRREETIRSSTQRARDSLTRLQDNFERVGRAYTERIEKARKNEKRARSIQIEDQSSGASQVTIRGDHRTFVTRPVREELPMVPGPKDVQ